MLVITKHTALKLRRISAFIHQRPLFLIVNLRFNLILPKVFLLINPINDYVLNLFRSFNQKSLNLFVLKNLPLNHLLVSFLLFFLFDLLVIDHWFIIYFRDNVIKFLIMIIISSTTINSILSRILLSLSFLLHFFFIV